MELVLSYLYVGYGDRAVRPATRLGWQVSFLYTILLGQFFETRSLPGTWNSLIRIYWLAREPHRYLPSPRTADLCHSVQIGLGTQTQSLMFVCHVYMLIASFPQALPSSLFKSAHRG